MHTIDNTHCRLFFLIGTRDVCRSIACLAMMLLHLAAHLAAIDRVMQRAYRPGQTEGLKGLLSAAFWRMAAICCCAATCAADCWDSSAERE